MSRGRAALKGAVFPSGTPRSWWLEEALTADPGEPCPPLHGDVRTDICVVGGGYTGLWTALELKERDPSLEVVVLEADICGGGASGRNGGFVTAWWDELPELEARFGAARALFLVEASEAAVEDIALFCERERIDAHYRRAGFVWAAAAAAQRGSYERAVERCAALGRPDALSRIDGAECRRRIGSPLLLDGVFMPAAASIQPALLARGLRRVALARGVAIYEGSPLRRLSRGRAIALETPRGRVAASTAVVAMNAWGARFRELRRAVVPVASHVVLSDPIPAALDRLGWTDGELFCDGRQLVHYAHVTADRRVAIGRGGGTIGVAGRIPARMHHDPRGAADVLRGFRRLFPELADVRFPYAWGGPIDRVPGSLHVPFFGQLDDRGRVVYGVGFSGNGVGPARIAGRVLASLALGAEDEWSRCALVGGPHALLPPEPFRSVGAVAVRAAVRRKEEREELGRPVDAFTRRLAGLAQFGLRGARRASAGPDGDEG